MPDGSDAAAETSLQHWADIGDYWRRGRLPWRRDARGVAAEIRLAPVCGAKQRAVARLSPLRRIEYVSAAEFSARLQARFRDEALNEAIDGLKRIDPDSSAWRVFSPGQTVALIFLSFALAAAIITAPLMTFIVLNAVATAYFLAVILFRCHLAALSIDEPPIVEESPTSATQIGPSSEDAELPIVTVLLPLFDEADCLPQLATAMAALDYPKDKLDIKLVLEERDAATRAEAARLGLADKFDVIVVPASAPQTKPKACNFAVAFARGDLVVIYDAEDQPAPDQLRKAAAAFAAGPPTLACVQARLNYYNADENWLTRLFSLEYALWFDSLLPALQKLRAPIPLGGTSNILRTDVLTAIGGWDPYNVTEDADLGLRIARKGFETALIDSTTLEEANCQVGNWLRQRSRWMKGYLQTWIVHWRAPSAFSGRGGWRAGLSSHLFLAGTVFSALINPLLWAVFAFWLFTRSSAVAAAFPEPLMTLNLFALLFGNGLFIYLAVAAPLRRGWPHLAPAALLAPAYWWLSSIAAYKAVWQLATRPFYWEKTRHNLSAAAQARRQSALKALEDAA